MLVARLPASYGEPLITLKRIPQACASNERRTPSEALQCLIRTEDPQANTGRYDSQACRARSGPVYHAEGDAWAGEQSAYGSSVVGLDTVVNLCVALPSCGGYFDRPCSRPAYTV